MSRTLKPATCVVWVGFSPVCLGRILGNDGEPITQATISSINRKIYRLDGTLISSAAVTVADAVSNTLITNDPRWTLDDEGRNFVDQPPVSNFASPNTAYFILYTFTPVSGEIFPGTFRTSTLPIPS